MHKIISLLATLLLLGACASGDQVASESALGDADISANVQLASLNSAASTEEVTSDDDDFEEDVNDPLETPNRLVFAFNEGLDVIILKPAAMTYRFLLPDGVRDSVQNFLRNLRSPVILANDMLQGDEDRISTTWKRFFINSTIGIGGLFDVADGMGYPFHDEDFGQTLGFYGVGEGFYLVLPILGPSSLRDGTGEIVDHFLDPLTYLVSTEVRLARRALSGVDERSRNIETIEEIQRDSVDFYARVRSLYRQHREAEIRNGEIDDSFDIPGVSEDVDGLLLSSSLQ